MPVLLKAVQNHPDVIQTPYSDRRIRWENARKSGYSYETLISTNCDPHYIIYFVLHGIMVLHKL